MKNLLVAIVILLGAFAYMAGAPLLVDERPHLAQIQSFQAGDFALEPELTTLPGFHYTLFGLSKILGIEGKLGLRCIAFALSLLTVFVYWRASRQPFPFLFLPLLFPFFFLLYTDVLALLFVLLGFLLVEKRKYHLAALASMAAVLVRQNAIVWLVFLLVLAYLREDLSPLESLRKFRLFLAGIGSFGIFVILNRGLAVGDHEAHPAFHIYPGNVYFLLFVCCILFLPDMLHRRRQMMLQLGKWPYIAAFFLLYIFTFENTHPYNLEWADYFVRNRLLVFFSQSILHKVLFFLPMAFMVVYLCTIRLRRKAFYALYPLTVLYLVPSWLIEQRYYIPPIALFLLCRKNDDEKTDWVTTGLWATISLCSLYGMKNGLFFP